MHIPWKEMGWALVFVVLLLVVYVGSYLALVKRGTPLPGTGEVHALYRIGENWESGEVIQTIFRPMNQLDRRLRPDYWSLAVFWGSR